MKGAAIEGAGPAARRELERVMALSAKLEEERRQEEARRRREEAAHAQARQRQQQVRAPSSSSAVPTWRHA